MIQHNNYPQALFPGYSEAAFMSSVASANSNSLASTQMAKHSSNSSVENDTNENFQTQNDKTQKPAKKRKPYSKACDWCRHHKKRCIPTATDRCQNCVKYNIDCLDTTLRKRRPSKYQSRYSSSDSSNSPLDYSSSTVSPPPSMPINLPPLQPYTHTNSTSIQATSGPNFVFITPLDINSNFTTASSSNALVQASKRPNTFQYITSPCKYTKNTLFSPKFGSKADVHFIIANDLNSSFPFVLHSPVRKMKLDPVASDIFQDIAEIPYWKINRLITWFFQYLHPHHPVVDPATFCYHWLNKSQRPDFLLLFGVVCTLGSGCYPPNEAQVLYPPLRRLVKKYLCSIYHRPSLFLIQALVLICPCLDILSEDRLMERGWYYQGIAYRYAIQLGLHLDRPDLSPEIQNMRKRMWWTIACRDITKAHSVGWPNFFNAHDTSMSLPRTSANFPDQLNIRQLDTGLLTKYFIARASLIYLISQMTTLRLEFTSFIKRAPCNQFPFISQRSVYDSHENKLETYQKRCLSLENFIFVWYRRLCPVFKTNELTNTFSIFHHPEPLLTKSIFSVNLHINFWSLLIEINMPLIDTVHQPLCQFDPQWALSSTSWNQMNPLQKCQIAAYLGSAQMEVMMESFIQCMDTYKWWCVIQLIRVHVYLMNNCHDTLGSTLAVHQRQLDMLIQQTRQGSKRHCVVRDVWYSLQPLLQDYLP